jgi:hypothetical protein
MIVKRAVLIITAAVVITVAAMPLLLAGKTERKEPTVEFSNAGERIVFAAKRDGNWIFTQRAPTARKWSG